MNIIKRIGIRCAVAFAGVATVWCVLECALAVTGWLHSRRPVSRHGTRTVVCVGDSVTYGVGVRQEETYAAQLERLLNGGSTGLWRVINAGQPAMNTAQGLVRLGALLAAQRPEAVTVLLGTANNWNYRGLHAHTNTVTLGRTWRWRAVELLQHSRVVVLCQLLGSAATRTRALRRTATPPHELLDARRTEMLNALLARAQAEPTNARARAHVGIFWLAEQCMDEAYNWFARAAALDPAESWAYIGAIRTLFSTPRSAEVYDWITNGLAHCPGTPELYTYEVQYLMRMGDYEGALHALSNAIAVHPSFGYFAEQANFLAVNAPHLAAAARAAAQGVQGAPGAMSAFAQYMEQFNVLPMSRLPSVHEKLAWASNDMERIVALCRAAHVPLIIETAPAPVMATAPAGEPPYKTRLVQLMRDIAQRHNVPLADHHQVFAAEPDQNALYLYGGRDTHPNPAGYALMASNLHAVITACVFP